MPNVYGTKPIIKSLPNGLTIILAPDATMPFVTTAIWVRAGSADEPSGLTGIAHLIEHVCFRGTAGFTTEQSSELVNSLGGSFNGSTWLDTTNYYDYLPSAYLELGIQFAAERLSAVRFDYGDVEAERTIVISELGMGENHPSNLLAMENSAMAFKIHGYGHDTIGYLSDLQSFTRNEIMDFYRQYYSPGNAALVISGGFEVDEALQLTEKHFGKIPSLSAELPRRTQEPKQRGYRCTELTAPAPATMLLMSFHTPNMLHPDFAALAVLNGILVGNAQPLYTMMPPGPVGRASLLGKELIVKGLCYELDISFWPTLDPYLFSIHSSLCPEVEVEKVEKAIWKVLDRLMSRGPSASDLSTAKSATITNLLNCGYAPADVASILGHCWALGDVSFPQRFLKELRKVKKEDVMAVVKKYFKKDNCVKGVLRPRSEETVEEKTTAPVVANLLPEVKPYHFQLPEFVRREIAPGLNLTVMPRRGYGLAELNLVLSGGRMGEKPADAGLTSLLCRCLTRGAGRWDASAYASEMEGIGAKLSFAVSEDSIGATGRFAPDKLPVFCELLSSALLSPHLAEPEIMKEREQLGSHLRNAEQDTAVMATRMALKALYTQDHPLGIPPTPEVVEKLSIKQVQERYAASFPAARGELVLVGDLDPDKTFASFKSMFEGWKGTRVSGTELPPPIKLTDGADEYINIPGKMQSDVCLAFPWAGLDNPEHFALLLLAHVYGTHASFGRMGNDIRRKQGLAYYAYGMGKSYAKTGYFTAYAGVMPDKVQQAKTTMLKHLRLLNDELVGEKELEESQRSYMGMVYSSWVRLSTAARVMAGQLFRDLGADYTSKLEKALPEVTAEKLRELANVWMNADAYRFAVAGPY